MKSKFEDLEKGDTVTIYMWGRELTGVVEERTSGGNLGTGLKEYVHIYMDGTIVVIDHHDEKNILQVVKHISIDDLCMALDKIQHNQP